MTKKSELDPLWTFFLEVSIQKLIQFVLLFNIWLVFTRIMCPITPFFMYMHRGPKKVTQTFLLYRWQYTLIMCYIISLCHVSILCKHTCVLVCLLMCVYVSCACIHTCVFRCLILSWNFCIRSLSLELLLTFDVHTNHPGHSIVDLRQHIPSLLKVTFFTGTTVIRTYIFGCDTKRILICIKFLF